MSQTCFLFSRSSQLCRADTQESYIIWTYGKVKSQGDEVFFPNQKYAHRKKKVLKSYSSFPYMQTTLPILPHSVHVHAYFLSKMINNSCFNFKKCLGLGYTFLVNLILTISCFFFLFCYCQVCKYYDHTCIFFNLLLLHVVH